VISSTWKLSMSSRCAIVRASWRSFCNSLRMLARFRLHLARHLGAQPAAALA
jgi:hypothetical protein